MACTSVTLNSFDARCDVSVGGIKRILIGNRDEVTKVTVDETTGKITTITTSAKFAEWRFRKNTGSLTSTVTSDPAIGNTFATTDLNLQFTKAEAQKRLDIQSAINANSVVIVEDMYGQYIYLGLENDVTVTNATMVTGTTMSDLNGFTLTLQDVATELPRFVDPTIIDGLLTA